MKPLGCRKLSACRAWRAPAVVAAIAWALCAAHPVAAQGMPSGAVGNGRDGAGSLAKTIAVGTSISVRNNETIDVQKSDGREFSGSVDQDVLDESGNVAIPKGSYAELIVKSNSDEYLALDLESIEVNGLRYTVTTISGRADGEPPSGLKTNARTENVVDGAKLVRAITQIVTRGKAKVLAASFLTFRLKQPSRNWGWGEDDLTCYGTPLTRRESAVDGSDLDDSFGKEREHALDYMCHLASVLASRDGDFLYGGRLNSHLAGCRIDRVGVPDSAGT